MVAIEGTESATMAMEDIFDKGSFIIPTIQRDYEWLSSASAQKNQVRVFLEDLWRFHTMSDEDYYFLGTQIVYSNPGTTKFQIMDGQQRLTTITALLSVIKSHLENHRDALAQGDEFDKVNEFILDEIDKYFWYFKGTKKFPVLTPKESSSKTVLSNLRKLRGKDPKSIDPPKDDGKTLPGGKNLLDAAIYMYNEVMKKAKLENKKDPNKELMKFVETLSKRVIITFTRTENISMAFQMYISVNGPNAKPLNTFDLFRGLLVQRAYVIKMPAKIEPRVNELNKKIRPIKRMGEKELDRVMTYWLESRKGENVLTNSVVSQLDKEINTFTKSNQFFDLMDGLEQFAKAFQLICNHDKMKKGKLIYPGYLTNRRILSYIGGDVKNSMHAGVYAPLALAFENEEYGDDEVERVMTLIEWFYVRYWYTKQGAKLENIFPFMAKKIVDLEPVEEWIDEIKEKFRRIISESDRQVGFQHLSDTPFKSAGSMLKIRTLLHRIRGSKRDPGPKLKSGIGCIAVKLMPTGAPSWSGNTKEKEDHNSVSGLIGNWFLLMNMTREDANNLPHSYPERIEIMAKHAHTTPEKKKLQALKERYELAGTGWTATMILKRTNELIKDLEEAYPDSPEYI